MAIRWSLMVLLAAPWLCADDWPGYRGGPARDGLCHETGLTKEWPEGGPPLLWQSAELGTGHSTLAVVGGTIYTLGDQGGTFLLALDAQDGKLKWKQPAGRGGATPTPSVCDGKVIFQLGGKVGCHCATDGTRLWQADIMSFTPKAKDKSQEWRDHTRYGSWHNSPVVALGKVFVVTGHPEACVIALDQNTGQLVWTSHGSKDASSRGWSSPIVVRHGGTDLLIAQTGWHVLGLDARDGTVFWEREVYSDSPGRRAGNSLCNVPLYYDGYLFCTTGYDPVIWTTYTLSSSGRELTPAWNSRAIHPFHESVACVNGVMFGHGDITWLDVDANPDLLINGRPFRELKSSFHPRPANLDPKNPRTAGLRTEDKSLGRSNYGGLVCQELKTGKVLGVRYGFPTTCFSGMMLVYADGRLYGGWSWSFDRFYLIEATPAMTFKGSFPIPPRNADPAEDAKRKGTPWEGFSAPVISGGRLFIRKAERLLAYDIREVKK